jgi:hypothetical protein
VPEALLGPGVSDPRSRQRAFEHSQSRHRWWEHHRLEAVFPYGWWEREAGADGTPREKSTGPVTAKGKRKAAKSAMKGTRFLLATIRAFIRGR